MNLSICCLVFLEEWSYDSLREVSAKTLVKGMINDHKS